MIVAVFFTFYAFEKLCVVDSKIDIWIIKVLQDEQDSVRDQYARIKGLALMQKAPLNKN